MFIIISRNKKFPILNGIIAILFGIIALFYPGMTIVTLAIVFAIAVLLIGLTLTLIAFKAGAESRNRTPFLLQGLISLAIGIFILVQPEFSAALFLAIIGIWAMIIGVLFIWTYSHQQLRSFTGSLTLFIGILSLIMGFLIILNPFESSRIIVILIGIYAITYGFSSIFMRR